MIANITCTTCGEVMGTLEKPAITDEDRAKWQAMMTCPNGHHTTSLDEIEPDPEG